MTGTSPCGARIATPRNGKPPTPLTPSLRQRHRTSTPRSNLWEEHFRWSTIEMGVLIGTTPIGRATIVGLQINAPTMLELRVLLNQLGLFPEIDDKHLPAK